MVVGARRRSVPPKRAPRISRRSCPNTCARRLAPATRHCANSRCTAAASAGRLRRRRTWLPIAHLGPRRADRRRLDHGHRCDRHHPPLHPAADRRPVAARRLRVQAALPGGERRSRRQQAVSLGRRAATVPHPDRAAADHRARRVRRASSSRRSSPRRRADFFRTVDVGKAGVIWVFHPDGVVLLQRAVDDRSARRSRHGQPDLRRREDAERASGTLVGPLHAGGPTLISAFHSTTAPPLIVAVSLDRNEVSDRMAPPGTLLGAVLPRDSSRCWPARWSSCSARWTPSGSPSRR